jgi:type IX secretion system PorP/SprF family membrane protein
MIPARLIILLAFIVFSSGLAFSQNDPLISQQGLQRFIYNPASTGTSDYHQIGFIHRNQWNGFPDAPSGNILTGHTFLPGYSMGLGIVVAEDKTGIEHNLNIKTSYAYHVWLNEKNILSFGLSAGLFSKRFDIGKLILEQPESLEGLYLENTVKPDFDCGFEFQRKNLIVGVSATHFLNSFENSSNTKHPRHIHAYVNAVQPLTENFSLKGIASYYNVRNINGFELAAIGELQEHFWAGLGLRFQESAIIMAGFYIKPNIRVGYSYDWNTNMLKRYSTGSHEAFLHFRINKKEIKSKSPRFFN